MFTATSSGIDARKHMHVHGMHVSMHASAHTHARSCILVSWHHCIDAWVYLSLQQYEFNDLKVRWAMHDDLAALAGQPVRLRLHLRDAAVYSFVLV